MSWFLEQGGEYCASAEECSVAEFAANLIADFPDLQEPVIGVLETEKSLDDKRILLHTLKGDACSEFEALEEFYLKHKTSDFLLEKNPLQPATVAELAEVAGTIALEKVTDSLMAYRAIIQAQPGDKKNRVNKSLTAAACTTGALPFAYVCNVVGYGYIPEHTPGWFVPLTVGSLMIEAYRRAFYA